MSTKPIAAWGFFATAGLNFIAAALPMAKGERMNVVFFGASVVFFVVGVVALRNYKASRKPDESRT